MLLLFANPTLHKGNESGSKQKMVTTLLLEQGKFALRNYWLSQGTGIKEDWLVIGGENSNEYRASRCREQPPRPELGQSKRASLRRAETQTSQRNGTARTDWRRSGPLRCCASRTH